MNWKIAFEQLWDFATFRKPGIFLLVPKKNLHRLKLSWSYAIEISISIRIKFFQIWFLYFISKRFRETSLNCCAIFRNNKIEKLAMFTLLIGLRIKHDSDLKKVFTFISMSFPNFAEFILWTVPESIQRGQIKNNPNRAKLFHFYKTNNVCFKKKLRQTAVLVYISLLWIALVFLKQTLHIWFIY